MKHLRYLGLILLMAVSFYSCSDDEVGQTDRQPGVTAQEWGTDEMFFGDFQKKDYNFTAAASWTATTDASDWCTVTASGEAGQSVLTVTLQANTTGSARTCTVTVVVSGHQGSHFNVTQQSKSGGSAAADPVNEYVDEYLLERYLWNEEYRNMERDLSIPYVSSSSNFLHNTLMNMKGNTLDKKPVYDEDGNIVDYSLYSYLNRYQTTGTRAISAGGHVNHGIQKDGNIMSYGFTRITTVLFLDGVGLAPMGVYPGSPADRAGVGRGDFILAVNGQEITESNYLTMAYEVLYPSSGSSVEVYVMGQQEPVTLEAVSLDPTPIVHHEVIDFGGARVGYLVYDSFNAAYDEDLLSVLGEMKSAGVTDLILDLRYNGGGHVITSNMLCSCIAGTATDGKVYQYYRYNDDRMATPTVTAQETGNRYDESVNRFAEDFYGTRGSNYYYNNLGDFALELDRLYVIISENTASASEAVINSLRGIDIPVTLIGTRSNGKNVGMESTSFQQGSYYYEFAPITFEGYNAKMNGVNPEGLEPDFEVEDWDNGFMPFGATEPAVAVALQQITGQTPETAVATRAQGMKIKRISSPLAKPLHPEGMIVPARTEE